MNLFTNIFRKNKSQETAVNLEIDTSKTSEKFVCNAEEIVSFLLEKLRLLHNLEQDFYEKHQNMPNANKASQFRLFFKKYNEQRKNIIDKFCTNPIAESSSLAKPTSYEYVNDTNTQIVFIMKSAKKAIVEIYYESGIAKKDQFTLKKVDNEWKIDGKKYGFQGESTWSKDDL